MTQSIVFMLLFIPCILNGQIDVESSQVTLIGMGIKNTTHTGILAKSLYEVQNGQFVLENPAFPQYHASGISMDCRHFEFLNNATVAVSWESLIYFVGEILGDSNEPYSGGFAFIAGQPTKELDTEELPDLTDIQKRWINLRYLEANGTYGIRALQFGIHLSLRELGYSKFTSYNSKDMDYQIANTSEMAGKLLLGPAIGFRKTMDDLSIVAFGSVSGSVNTRDSYKLKYSPHAEASVFYGKKIGVFGTAYFRKFIGKEITYNGVNVAPGFSELSLHFGLYFCTGY